MRILITGGAGYIGSVTSSYLLDIGHEINILDDLSTGNKEFIDDRTKFYLGSILDQHSLDSALKNCEAVIHLAGQAIVSDSFKSSDEYVKVNHFGTRQVLESMIRNSVETIVFSSTCAVYGEPNNQSITEKIAPDPINPYGKSKHLADLEISNFTQKYGLNSTSLRFFNVAGAYRNSKNKLIGEAHVRETHLIPRILKNRSIEIFGNDFKTPDGTCVRDYVHVSDIAKAIYLSLENRVLAKHKVYNLGSGRGYSVLEVIHTVEKVLHTKINVSVTSKNIGDPAYLVGNGNLAKNEIGWKNLLSLEQMIEDAQNFIDTLI